MKKIELESPPAKKGKIFILIPILVLLGVFLFFFLVNPLLALKKESQVLVAEAKTLTAAIQNNNLNEAVAKVDSTKSSFTKIEGNWQKMSWLKFVPLASGYWKDGRYLLNAGQNMIEVARLSVDALQPYADLLGIEPKKEGAKDEVLTMEKRLLLVLDTLDKIKPSLDQISVELDKAQVEADKVKLSHYPEKVMGKNVRENVSVVIEMIDSFAKIIGEIKPVVSYLRPLLGLNGEQKYLLLFQNDAELRPTGGFLTAYAILSVNKGNFKPLGSYDIYGLDARFGNRLKAPEPITKYHKNVYNWHLRDMNLSPDFKVSMETFWENYQKVGPSNIAGIIAVDTQVLVDILKILGPIGVADWGRFSAETDKRCDCPQVVYELELAADKPLGIVNTERKALIGPLMHSLLLNMMQSPRKKWPEFFNLMLTNIQEKHILFYFPDKEIQGSIEALNAGGRIRDFEGDYLHLNNCNFGGAKSNLFIKEAIEQVYEVGNDGVITKTVTVDYTNPAPPSDCNLERGNLCLNGLYRDWIRLYVPKGSELIEVKGSEVEARTYEDLGKTVFEAFFGDKAPLRPQGKGQLVFKYKLPFKFDKNQGLDLLIQKQAGVLAQTQTIKFNGQEQIFELETDKEIKL